jgi:hypothetical protein
MVRGDRRAGGQIHCREAIGTQMSVENVVAAGVVITAVPSARAGCARECAGMSTEADDGTRGVAG